MITAAKRLSQVATHMGIAYALAYGVSGSAMLSGLAVLVEPVINVLLLPIHVVGWARLRSRAPRSWVHCMTVCEKLSQLGLHAGIAFGVMYVATGSLALGGIAALLEPLCNVLVLPLHDRLWEHLERGGATTLGLT